MNAKSILILSALIALSGCHIPAFPKVLPYEKCNQVPPDRLFNKETFSPGANKAELRVIHDVGSSGEYGFVTVAIGSTKFAVLRVWESSTIFINPGPHTVDLYWMDVSDISARRPQDSLQINVTSNSVTTVRIDLGRSNPPLLQT